VSKTAAQWIARVGVVGSGEGETVWRIEQGGKSISPFIREVGDRDLDNRAKEELAVWRGTKPQKKELLRMKDTSRGSAEGGHRKSFRGGPGPLNKGLRIREELEQLVQGGKKKRYRDALAPGLRRIRGLS